MTAERWVPVKGYEGLYEVSDRGRMKSLPRKDARGALRKERLLKPYVMKHGHHQTGLTKDGVTKYHLIHRLVLEAFVGPCPEGMEACHGEGGPSDNRVENIRWDTRSENMKDVARHGRHAGANKTHCVRGHLLSEPNLIVSQLKRDGARSCRSCNRAHNYLNSRGESKDKLQEVSDGYYKRIMGEKS